MTRLGKADWIYDHELKTHVPSCSVQTGEHEIQRCGDGPLTTDKQIRRGDCGASHSRSQRFWRTFEAAARRARG